jgi:ankyrin repeat protein
VTKTTTGTPAYGELLEAAYDNDITRVKDLLQRGADLDERDIMNSNALHMAAMYGHTEVALLLVAKGADVNARGYKDITPLGEAAFCGHTETVRFLIENGADVNATTEQGGTALMSCAWDGHTELARLLIENGADISASDKAGNTALSIAKNKKHKELALLLEDPPMSQKKRRLVREEQDKVRDNHDTAVERQKALKARAPKVVIRGLQA